MAASYLTQEDGSRILLEDGTGALITAADPGTPDPCSILTEDGDFLVTEDGEDLILEECGLVFTTPGGHLFTSRRRPYRPQQRTVLAAKAADVDVAVFVPSLVVAPRITRAVVRTYAGKARHLIALVVRVAAPWR